MLVLFNEPSRDEKTTNGKEELDTLWAAAIHEGSPSGQSFPLLEGVTKQYSEDGDGSPAIEGRKIAH